MIYEASGKYKNVYHNDHKSKFAPSDVLIYLTNRPKYPNIKLTLTEQEKQKIVPFEQDKCEMTYVIEIITS